MTTPANTSPNKTTTEHPFAQYVRILGKGKRGARSLTIEEAEDAMQLIMEGKVEDAQLGAFLMLLRVKEESPEEMAGFVRAARKTIAAPNISADLDWGSYAGKRKHLPWFLLSAFVLAGQGIKVFMHGSSGHTAGRLYTDSVLPALGFELADSWQVAQQQLSERNFCYMSLEHIDPTLQRLIGMRQLLGLRSPVHTLARLLNPTKAPCSLQSIFHPAYGITHQQASVLLEQPAMAVIKGDGGEFERKADATCSVKQVLNNSASEEKWPRLLEQKHPEEEQLDPMILKQVWNGDVEHLYGINAVIGTLAILLKLMGHANTQQEAMELAEKWWNERNKGML